MKATARFLFRHKYSFILALFLATPLYIYAQSVGAEGLVPCGAVSSSNYSLLNPNYYLQATACNFCYLAKLIQNVVNFLVMVTIPISVAMFAWAGILFFTATGDPKRINRARSIFRSVLIGFIITITGWLVVQVVLQSITRGDFYTANNWVNLNCDQMYGGTDQPNRPRNIDISQVLSTLQVAPGTSGGSSSVSPGQPGSVDGTAVTRAARSGELQAACVNNSTADCSLLQAICVVESGCNPQTTGCNSAGACGPMQIKPATACEANPSLSGCNANGTVRNQYEVAAALSTMTNSTDTAAKILNKSSSACGGDLNCVMAYYNGGGGAVQASACCPSGTAAWQCQWDCNSRIPGSVNCTAEPRPSACVQNTGYIETRNYVPKIEAAQNALRTPTQTTGGAF